MSFTFSWGLKIRNKLFLEWGERFVWPDKEATMYGKNVFCYGMRDHFGILCDGTVVPCCLDSDGVIALGNILKTPLDTVLFSPRAEAIKKGFECRTASEELCKRCGYSQRWSLDKWRTAEKGSEIRCLNFRADCAPVYRLDSDICLFRFLLVSWRFLTVFLGGRRSWFRCWL